MPESIKKRISQIPDHITGKELRPILNAILTDLTALQTKHNAVCTKLDADGGVTDTNYNSLHAVSSLQTTA